MSSTRMPRHLISIDDLDRSGIEQVLDRAESFAEVSGREIKKVPALRGRTIVNLFYEASTRTSSSFELAAKRLSADVVNIRSAGSSVDKGESLKDTVQTLSAYDPAAIVIRSPHAGAAQLVAGWTEAAVVNAGDGKHEHPTQALLDVFTLRRRFGSLDRLNIWIVGDVSHSRVARSDILAFTRMGADVTVCGPPTLLPRQIEALGCAATPTLDGSRRPTWSTSCACSTSGCISPSSHRCGSTPAATRSTTSACAPTRSSCTPGRSIAASSSRRRRSTPIRP